MTANYHTHTWRCHHARGTEREYVENAIRAGLKTLGFSDHSPQLFPNGYVSDFRMLPEELDGYVSTILALREEYRDQISIPLGLELEYYPNYLPQLLPVLRDQPIDYLLLGQHFVEDEITGWYVGIRSGDRHRLVRYCDQVIDAMQLGIFTYLAHPDVIRFEGDDKFYTQQVRRLCREARSCGIPLEINLLGVMEQRHYPTPLFWQAAGEEGCPVVMGRDAHQAEALLDFASEEKALKLVKKYGLNLLEDVPLRRI